jgi:hypothetical protein
VTLSQTHQLLSVYAVNIDSLYLTFSGKKTDEAVAAHAQKYSSVIEGFIIRHPVDLYRVHRLWKLAGELVTE